MRCEGQGEFYTDERTGRTCVREPDWINVRADRKAFEEWVSISVRAKSPFWIVLRGLEFG